jgi:hypothetical protein
MFLENANIVSQMVVVIAAIVVLTAYLFGGRRFSMFDAFALDKRRAVAWIIMIIIWLYVGIAFLEILKYLTKN